jgi:drug/metabolite transporter (DMT)-like permease
MALIVGGAVVLSWPGEYSNATGLPALAVLLACFCWGLDNNLTRKVALADASYIAMLKGLSAGLVNVTVALLAGALVPEPRILLASSLLGFFSYGLSLVLFVTGLRHLGTARTAAYFSTAPFVGAVLAIPLLQESVTINLFLGAAFMAVGVWLHLTERHEHEHTHEALEHEHEHVHDEHHQHDHEDVVVGPHTHLHRHEPITHTHPHYPDAHHRHKH